MTLTILSLPFFLSLFKFFSFISFIICFPPFLCPVLYLSILRTSSSYFIIFRHFSQAAVFIKVSNFRICFSSFDFSKQYYYIRKLKNNETNVILVISKTRDGLYVGMFLLFCVKFLCMFLLGVFMCFRSTVY